MIPMKKSDQASALIAASHKEAISTKGRKVLDSTREGFYAKAKAAKAKLGNDHGGVLAGPVKKIRKT